MDHGKYDSISDANVLLTLRYFRVVFSCRTHKRYIKILNCLVHKSQTFGQKHDTIECCGRMTDRRNVLENWRIMKTTRRLSTEAPSSTTTAHTHSLTQSQKTSITGEEKKSSISLTLIQVKMKRFFLLSFASFQLALGLRHTTHTDTQCVQRTPFQMLTQRIKTDNFNFVPFFGHVRSGAFSLCVSLQRRLFGRKMEKRYSKRLRNQTKRRKKKRLNAWT